MNYTNKPSVDVNDFHFLREVIQVGYSFVVFKTTFNQNLRLNCWFTSLYLEKIFFGIFLEIAGFVALVLRQLRLSLNPSWDYYSLGTSAFVLLIFKWS